MRRGVAIQGFERKVAPPASHDVTDLTDSILGPLRPETFVQDLGHFHVLDICARVDPHAWNAPCGDEAPIPICDRSKTGWYATAGHWREGEREGKAWKEGQGVQR